MTRLAESSVHDDSFPLRAGGPTSEIAAPAREFYTHTESFSNGLLGPIDAGTQRMMTTNLNKETCMHDANFINTRFDPNVAEFDSLAHAMAAAYGYTARLAIDAKLAELLRLRVAQLNPCSYCLILHTRAAKDAGIEADKVAHLTSWRQSTVFTAEEAAALAYAEALTVFDHVGFEQHYTELRRLLPAEKVAEIAAVVINMNVWTRWKLAQGSVPTIAAESSRNEHPKVERPARVRTDGHSEVGHAPPST